MISPDKIKKAILEGASLFVEFKKVLPQPESLASEIVALANTEGGLIIIGVNDQGRVQGLKKTSGLEEKVMNIARANIEPALAVDFLILEIQNKKVAGIKVPKSPSRPHKTNEGRYYIRVGTTKRFPSQEELGRLYQNKGLVYFDLNPVQDASTKDIDMNKVNGYFRQTFHHDIYSKTENIEPLMLNLEILAEKEQKLHPTIAGLLFFGEQPQRYLKGASIKAACFKGTNIGSEILQKQDIMGDLPSQIKAAMKFVRANMKTRIEMKGIERKEIPQFPLPAVREIIVNAVAHRDYSILNQKIRLFLFKDRLEVISPGRLPNTVTLENMVYKQASRNPTIVRFLNNLGFSEQIGMGIYRVIQIMKKHNLTSPKFEIIDEEFKATLIS